MDQSPDVDQLVAVLPIHYSDVLAPNVQIHQFPLLNRPLQAPPSSVLSDRRIHARLRPTAQRLEVHVPADTRPEVWNAERGQLLGTAQSLEDREKNQEPARMKHKTEEEPRLDEVRFRSEQISHRSVYMLGAVRDGMRLAPGVFSRSC
jgi:DNA-directed RNA polymerase III subunit RPC5